MGLVRTLGLDPGTARMGWGLVEETAGTLRALDYGVLTTAAGDEPAHRLLLLHQGLADLLRKYSPDAAAVEELFFSRNVTTALGVGQARGVALLTFAQAGVPVFEYTPREVKQAVVGYGAADKQQIQEMVRLTLQLETRPRPDDAADALAIAICHAYTAPVLRRIQAKTESEK